MSSILIADDHAVVRAGLRAILRADTALSTVEEAANAAEVFEKFSTRPWDLLLLDIHLRGDSGMAVLEAVRSQFAKTPVLVVSGLPEGLYATEVLRAGAAGFLPKESAPSELLRAVRRVLSGHRYVSSRAAEQMAAELDKPVLRHEQLSERERQVFGRLAVGKTITAVADELTLSVKTVSTYRARILEKMGLQSNADITAYALRHKLPAAQSRDADQLGDAVPP